MEKEAHHLKVSPAGGVLIASGAAILPSNAPKKGSYLWLKRSTIIFHVSFGFNLGC